ncbi:MAG: hypothetical protein SGI72_02870 [Planctomycetota bacterium]|nr:hypothetical protein [Planctomycetota bacterium]
MKLTFAIATCMMIAAASSASAFDGCSARVMNLGHTEDLYLIFCLDPCEVDGLPACDDRMIVSVPGVGDTLGCGCGEQGQTTWSGYCTLSVSSDYSAWFAIGLCGTQGCPWTGGCSFKTWVDAWKVEHFDAKCK